MKATFILFLSSIFFSSTAFSQTGDSIQLSNAVPPVGLLKTSPSKNVSAAAIEKNLSIKSFIVPVVFIAYGFTSLGNNSFRQLNKNISSEVEEDMPGFKTRVDDYLKYAPAVSTYALNIAGVKGKHRLLD